ncbi:iron chaperone [Guptibacillus hwajinpoensis]|uniref:iron chaperone n=1 Tax=Guptibacillus hwajinpoensis TaxID=208199 RepID=UPI001CFD04B4|nr:DUF1801 domain-containing protein [Pseudalkalibacillus hwajinpoensis]WLR59019.1 DUF1801 domain-containing protein [Pseudalkalibacillus hwajinpoensis]
MQYEAKTPEEYFEMLEDDWRKEKLLAVRQYIIENAPELEEGIQYKMLSYKGKSSVLFNLNAQKSYVSLYVGDIKKIDRASELLYGLDCGKGCIRIKKSIDLQESGVEEFVKEVINQWRAGEDLSC